MNAENSPCFNRRDGPKVLKVNPTIRFPAQQSKASFPLSSSNLEQTSKAKYSHHSGDQTLQEEVENVRRLS